VKPEGGSLAGGAIEGADRDQALTSVAGIALERRGMGSG
jgi:hypothetical protein